MHKLSDCGCGPYYDCAEHDTDPKRRAAALDARKAVMAHAQAAVMKATVRMIGAGYLFRVGDRVSGDGSRFGTVVRVSDYGMVDMQWDSDIHFSKPACECGSGSDAIGLGHSHWCQQYRAEAT